MATTFPPSKLFKPLVLLAAATIVASLTSSTPLGAQSGLADSSRNGVRHLCSEPEARCLPGGAFEETLTFTGDRSCSYQLTLNWGDGRVRNRSYTYNGSPDSLVVKHSYRRNGTYQFSISGQSQDSRCTFSRYSGAVQVVTASAHSCAGQPATIIGTQGADRIVGTAGPDVVVSRGGNDIIRTVGGDDIVCSGHGNDLVRSGTGFDIVFGGAGRDRLFGGPSVDYLAGGGGRDKLAGGPGDDILIGGPGRDRLSGRGGKDKLQGSAGNDVLIAGVGNDQLNGGPGQDRCRPGPGRDTKRNCERS